MKGQAARVGLLGQERPGASDFADEEKQGNDELLCNVGKGTSVADDIQSGNVKKERKGPRRSGSGGDSSLYIYAKVWARG